MGIFREFREFALRGNVIDMAIGIIIGVAFASVVKSLVENVLMPPLGLLIGGVDFSSLFVVLRQGAVPGPYPTLQAAQSAGAVTINYGTFINSVIVFLLVALAVFALVRAINVQRRPKAQPAQLCIYCKTEIPQGASRCPHCTSELKAA